MEYFGYKSALFSNNPFLSESTGLATGFSHVSNLFIDNKINANNARVKTVLNLIQNDHTRRGFVDLAYKIASVIPDKRLDSMYLSMRKRLNRHFSKVLLTCLASHMEPFVLFDVISCDKVCRIAFVTFHVVYKDKVPRMPAVSQVFC